MSDIKEIISYIFIFIGLGFNVIGCLGLVRFPDMYSRIQATTKCVTFGTCCILAGTIIKEGLTGGGIKALLCIVFLLLTAPAAGHALCKGAHIFGIKPWDKSVCDKYEEDKK